MIFVLVVLLPACNAPGDYRSFPSFPPPPTLAAPNEVATERVSPPPAPGPRAAPAHREPAESSKPLLAESDIREQQLVVERSLPPPSPLPSVTTSAEPASAKSAAPGPALTGPPMAELPVPEPPLPKFPSAEQPPPERAPAPATVLLKEATIKGKAEPVFPVGEPAGSVPSEKAVSGVSLREAEEPSLIELITPQTPPQRAASLRLTEEGRMLLQTRQYEKGLARLEKAIALDSRNRHAYYYLAEAHYHLSHHQQSRNFLEIIEPSLGDEPKWLARLYALEGENLRALGFFERADRKYMQALALDPFNRVAFKGLAYLPDEIIAPVR